MSIKEEDINFAGKTFKGRESNMKTIIYICIMTILTIISIVDSKRKAIGGLALHLLTLGDAYMIILHGTSTIAFKPTTFYFYGFGFLTILNLIQVAIMGSKYLGKYGIKGQLYVALELIGGFTLTNSNRRILHFIIVCPWINTRFNSKFTKKLTLLIRFVMICYWLGISSNPLNKQTDYIGMICCILLIIFQWNSKCNEITNENKTQLYQVNTSKTNNTKGNEKNEVEEPIVCPICLDEIEENSAITTCKHVFHEDCLNMWLEEHTDCPYCRTELKNL